LADKATRTPQVKVTNLSKCRGVVHFHRKGQFVS